MVYIFCSLILRFCLQKFFFKSFFTTCKHKNKNKIEDEQVIRK